MELIKKYFPELNKVQLTQFENLYQLYADWNQKINLISRKDLDRLYERHILHSLGIACFIRFKSGSRILDVGCGGGFPGIPLAILFPEVEFVLLDSIAKKIRAAEDIALQSGLNNVQFRTERAENEKGLYDFVVSRAVMPMPDLYKICRKNLSGTQRNALPNGILALKGGDLSAELSGFGPKAVVTELSQYFEEEFFATKKVVYLSF
jgi:16S rRNA (guanine527-N7)-methyltransferase